MPARRSGQGQVTNLPTSEAAAAILKEFGRRILEKHGLQFHYMIDGGFAFCPVCGSSAMKNHGLRFAAFDGENPITKEPGVILYAIISHENRRCLWGLAGAPAQGQEAEQINALGQAMQVMNMEALMKGHLQERH